MLPITLILAESVKVAPTSSESSLTAFSSADSPSSPNPRGKAYCVLRIACRYCLVSINLPSYTGMVTTGTPVDVPINLS